MNPWVDLPSTAPFVLPSDAPLVDAFNGKAHPLHRIRTEAIPEPFFGRFEAPVVLLLLNPGFSRDGQHIPEAPEFVQAMRSYLRTGDADHLHLAPEASGPGFAWWSRATRALREATSREAVARSLLSIEYFPYHSISFGHGRLRLPSQTFTFDLLRRAIERSAMIIAARGYRIWLDAVPALASYPHLLRLRSPQRISISPGNLGAGPFESVVAAVEGASYNR